METADRKPSPLTLAYITEHLNTPEKAREYLESVHWPDGPVCPHCGVVNEATDLSGVGKKARPGTYKCNACKGQFTVTVGTVMEDSHLPLHKWLMAIHLLCANKKGISSLSLSRMLGVSTKTAWHLTMRIRHAMRDTSTEPLGGTGKVVEVDETFVGGKEGNKHKSKRGFIGRGPDGKTPVVALVERGGKLHARTVTNVDQDNVGPILKAKMAAGSVLMTDGGSVYWRHVEQNPNDFAAHHVVNHTRKEYVRVEADGFSANTQTVESFNAMLKRSIMGAWHNVSAKHLDRYVDEVAFRWNLRTVSDGERTNAAIIASEGKRLPYRPIKTPEGVREPPPSLV